MGRLFRFSLLLSALISLVCFIFGEQSLLSLSLFVGLGVLWYTLSMLKLKSLDAPRPREGLKK